MSCFKITPLEIPDVRLVQPTVFSDARGFFFESFQEEVYRAHGIDAAFMQDNVAFSKKEVVRGLHYQEGKGQAKLVSCLAGKIWDVAVDIRPHSPTYGKWVGVELSEISHHQLFIPEGFAHGYCVLSDSALVTYKVSLLYDPKLEKTIRWDDPDLQIPWPVQNPVLSERDQRGPLLKEAMHALMDHWV